MIDRLFSPHSDTTTYLGEDMAPWDATQTYWHFVHYEIFENSAPIDTYWDMQTGKLKWILKS
jgi:hypothetical protein